MFSYFNPRPKERYMRKSFTSLLGETLPGVCIGLAVGEFVSQSTTLTLPYFGIVCGLLAGVLGMTLELRRPPHCLGLHSTNLSFGEVFFVCAPCSSTLFLGIPGFLTMLGGNVLAYFCMVPVSVFCAFACVRPELIIQAIERKPAPNIDLEKLSELRDLNIEQAHAHWKDGYLLYPEYQKICREHGVEPRVI